MFTSPVLIVSVLHYFLLASSAVMDKITFRDRCFDRIVGMLTSFSLITSIKNLIAMNLINLRGLLKKRISYFEILLHQRTDCRR